MIYRKKAYFLRSIFIVMFMLLLSFQGKAQIPVKIPKWRAPIDTLTRSKYIYRDRRSFTLFIFLTKYNNAILYKARDARNLFYQPITPLNFGLGFTHKMLTIGISVVSPYLNPSSYGEVKNTTLQLTAYGKRYGAELFFYSNTGYRLTNHVDFVRSIDPTSTAALEYPDMGMVKTGMNLIWVAHPEKYSLKASTNLMERQRRNAQSFLMNISFTYMTTHNDDSSFVPPPFEDEYKDRVNLTRGYFFTFAPSPGYGFNWRIKKRFFYDFSLSAGPSIQYQNYFDQNEYNARITFSYLAIIRTTVGYHGKRWVTSLGWVGGLENYPLSEKTSLLNHVGKFQFKIGYKFGLPKWARSYSDKLDDIEDEVERHMPMSH